LFKFILPFLFSINLFSQNYLWPTDASNALSSSFCEYRPGHYHSAIDIKTWNKEGYKCFAIEDGVIERIKISPFGAGKALYIKLNDGRRAVYFHLQKFTKKLEQKISERQRAEKSYSIEWWPKDWQVKKGEIVAYTGQTGIGVPHLHFEIRDKNSRPFNPLKFYKNVKDKIRPRLKELLIIPQNETSLVNGSFRPRKIPLSLQGNIYLIKEAIHAKGLLGFAVSGYDQADGVNNKIGFYKSKLMVENKARFKKAYDKLSFKNTRMVDIDIYYPEKARTRKRFYKLYIESFNKLGFYDRSLGDGLIHVKEDTLNFEISIEDYFKNRSIVKGKILPGTYKSVKLNQFSVLNESVYLKLTVPKEIKNLKFFSGKVTDKLKEITYFEIIDHVLNGFENIMFLKVRLAEKGDYIIQSVFENKFGQIVKTPAVFRNSGEKEIKSSINLYGKQLYLSFKNMIDSENLTLNIYHDGIFSKNSLNISNNMSEFVFPAKFFSGGDISFNLQDINNVYFDTTFTPNLLLPNQAQIFSFNEDSLKISSTENTAYDSLFFIVKKEVVQKENYDLPVFGSSYKMSIGEQILNRNLRLSLKSDSTFFTDGRAAIYSVNGKGLNFVGGKYDPKTKNISTQVKTFSTYIIAADTIAPEIKIKTPLANKIYKQMPEIVFKALDTISKIGSDRNIEIYFDDDYVVPEWDFERNIVKGVLHYVPIKGKHEVVVKVKDQAGNVTKKMVSFFIN
jgi:hypothetical protein